MIWRDRITLATGEVILPEQVVAINILDPTVDWRQNPNDTETEPLASNLIGARFDRGMKHEYEWWYERDRFYRVTPNGVRMEGVLVFNGERFCIKTDTGFMEYILSDWHRVEEADAD
jgi:hypothetical protein